MQHGQVAMLGKDREAAEYTFWDLREKAIARAALAAMPNRYRAGMERGGWYDDMSAAPMDVPLLAVVEGDVRVIKWGKTSHVPIYGWCLADQGAEDFDLCEPTAWQPMPTVAARKPHSEMERT